MGRKGRNIYKNNPDFVDSALVNSMTYYDYIRRFRQVALSQFEWINLPESMNADFLEMCLYYFGQCAILKAEDYGIINTKCTTNGALNIYGLPTQLNCYSKEFNFTRKLYTGKIDGQTDYDCCILVKNNWDRTPTAGTLELFAKRLYEAERTCDVNVKSMKTPLIIAGDEQLQLTLKNLYLKYDGNEPVIFVDKKQLGDKSIQAVKTDSPIVFDKLMIYKMQIWNEALTYLGINNVAVEKKERLVESEATGNNEMINLNLQARYQTRKRACEQMNEYFGLKGTGKEIDVKVRSDLYNIVKTTDSVFKLPPEEKELVKEEVL